MRKRLLLGILFGWACGAVAQMPHQVAVLVNENSQASKKAASVFAAAHGVPGCNMIYLNIPDALTRGRAECTPDQFMDRIYTPAQSMLEERGLSAQVSAWVYSVDFPIRILNSTNDRQQMSLMGLTFTRGKVPAGEMIEKGQFPSPLFSGPVKEGGPKNPSRSFLAFQTGLKEKMPLPSMMLGYVGENGNDMATVLACIERGISARKTGRDAEVLFVETDDDARSKPREWQYAGVQADLTALGRKATICSNAPAARTGLLGVMTGAENIQPSAFGTFVPGAMAEHLTSWSAEFQKRQSKCTEWLTGGATVTAGMVTEPYNAWVKFPHACFFTHYASGCTAMESFYQSVASPLQILFLGNPLSQITGLPVQIKPVGLSREISSDMDAAFVTDAKFPVAVHPVYSALLDGKQIKGADGISLVELPFEEMGDGYHDVRLIVQANSPVTPGGFADVPVLINKKGRSMALAGIEDRAPQIAVSVRPSANDLPTEVYVLWNGRELDRKPYCDGVELLLDERELGEGPHRLQAVAVYGDGMIVRSVPRQIGVAFAAAEPSK